MCARSIFGLALVLALPFGCANKGETQVMQPVVLGMLETAAPTYDDGQMQIYEAYLPVELPLRQPSDDERPKARPIPTPRPPFHLASDTRITARFTLSNLEDKEHTVELLVNPWNEFVRYEPGVIVTEEETTPNLSGINSRVILPPLGRLEGIITPDDFVELATDLGTAMKLHKTPPPADSQFAGPALYNRAFNVVNRSSEPDLVLGPYFPAVVANIVGFDLGLRTYEHAKISVEVVMDIEDLKNDRVIAAYYTDKERVGRPGKALTPPPPPMRP